MKRKLVLSFLFVILLTLGVHAAGTYHLDELGMRIDVPMGYTVVMRNMDPRDPALEMFNMDSAEITDMMKENNIYLDLLNENPAFEFTVTMQPSEVESIDQLDGTAMKSLEEAMAEQYEASGFSTDTLERYTAGQTTFVRALCSGLQDGFETQILQYYTIHDSQAVTLTLRYEGEEIPEDYQKLEKELIDSVRFDDAPPPAEPFEYLDSETGVRFVVPAGWVEVLVDQSNFNADQQKAVRATFSCTAQPNLAIVYACTDVMEQMPGLFKMFADRSMIDMEAISLDDLVEALPYEVRSAETQNIAGRDFYVLEVSGTTSVAGTAVDFTETDVIRIENGYEYTFQFAGTADDPRYPEFLTLVENAEFPKVEAPEAEAAPEAAEEPAEAPELISPSPEAEDVETPAPAPAEKKKGVPLLPIVLGLIAIGVIIGVAARGKKKKQVQQTAYAVPAPEAQAAPAPTEAPEEPQKRVCAACGADLAEGEDACPYCGTKAE